MSKILLVEDDCALAESIKEWLVLQHHAVEVVDRGSDASDRLRFYSYDIVILDWELPEMSGIEVLKEFRCRGGATPVLILTGKKEIEEKEEGLDSGADDYLTKPFHMKELSARIRALLRRPKATGENILSCGDLTLDPEEHLVLKDGIEIPLMPAEFALLEFFLRHPNQTFSPEAIIDRVWPSTSEISPESVRTYIMRLRKKIEKRDSPPLIQTVYGVGYKLATS